MEHETLASLDEFADIRLKKRACCLFLSLVDLVKDLFCAAKK